MLPLPAVEDRERELPVGIRVGTGIGTTIGNAAISQTTVRVAPIGDAAVDTPVWIVPVESVVRTAVSRFRVRPTTADRYNENEHREDSSEEPRHNHFLDRKSTRLNSSH